MPCLTRGGSWNEKKSRFEPGACLNCYVRKGKCSGRHHVAVATKEEAGLWAPKKEVRIDFIKELERDELLTKETVNKWFDEECEFCGTRARTQTDLRADFPWPGLKKGTSKGAKKAKSNPPKKPSKSKPAAPKTSAPKPSTSGMPAASDPDDAIDTAQKAVMEDQHSEASGAESEMIPEDDVIIVDDPLPAPPPPTSPRKRRNAPNSAEASGSAGSAGGPARKKARNSTRGTSRKVQPAAADEFKESTPIPDDEVSACHTCRAFAR